MRLQEIKTLLNEVTFANLNGGGIAFSDNAQAKLIIPLVDTDKFDFNVDPLFVVKIETTDQPAQKNVYTIQVPPEPKPGKAQYALTLKNSNDQVIQIRGSKSTIEGAFVHSDPNKVSNRGEIAEGILGAGLFAKLKKRAGASVGQIDVNDIWEVIDTLKQTGKDTYSVKLPDEGQRAVKDNIEYTLKLKAAPWKDITNKDKRVLLADLAQSSANYSNSKHAEKYANYFYLNGKPDSIHIISDGVSDEAGKKTDVEVVVNGRPTRLNISLKVGGVGQFGQIGGSEFENLFAFFDKFGVDITLDEKKFNRLDDMDGRKAAVEFVYTKAAQVLKDLLEGAYDDEEYRYLEMFADAVSYFTTLNNPMVQMVDFSKGGYTVYRFDRIKERLHDHSLTASYIGTKEWPVITIHDAENPKDILLQFRVKKENKPVSPDYPEGFYLRNIIEKGSMFAKIFTTQQYTPPKEKKATRAASGAVTGAKVAKGLRATK
jgi:hypothetical protein